MCKKFSYSVPCFLTFGANLQIHSELAKIRTRKTPNADPFDAVESDSVG